MMDYFLTKWMIKEVYDCSFTRVEKQIHNIGIKSYFGLISL